MDPRGIALFVLRGSYEPIRGTVWPGHSGCDPRRLSTRCQPAGETRRNRTPYKPLRFGLTAARRNPTQPNGPTGRVGRRRISLNRVTKKSPARTGLFCDGRRLLPWPGASRPRTGTWTILRSGRATRFSDRFLCPLLYAGREVFPMAGALVLYRLNGSLRRCLRDFLAVLKRFLPCFGGGLLHLV
jgi:hypothetical protein